MSDKKTSRPLLSFLVNDKFSDEDRDALAFSNFQSNLVEEFMISYAERECHFVPSSIFVLGAGVDV